MRLALRRALDVTGSGAALAELSARPSLFVIAPSTTRAEWYPAITLLRSALRWVGSGRSPDATSRGPAPRCPGGSSITIASTMRSMRFQDARDYPAAVADDQESEQARSLTRVGAPPRRTGSIHIPEDPDHVQAPRSVSPTSPRRCRHGGSHRALRLDVAARMPRRGTVGGWRRLKAAELTVRGSSSPGCSPMIAYSGRSRSAMLEEAVASRPPLALPDHPIAMIGLSRFLWIRPVTSTGDGDLGARVLGRSHAHPAVELFRRARRSSGRCCSSWRLSGSFDESIVTFPGTRSRQDQCH